MLFLCLGECRRVSIGALIGYAYARLKKENEDVQFRYYVADALYAFCETVAEALGGECLAKRFCDVLFPMAETHTGDDVLRRVLSQIGFNGGDGD